MGENCNTVRSAMRDQFEQQYKSRKRDHAIGSCMHKDHRKTIPDGLPTAV